MKIKDILAAVLLVLGGIGLWAVFQKYQEVEDFMDKQPAQNLANTANVVPVPQPYAVPVVMPYYYDMPWRWRRPRWTRPKNSINGNTSVTTTA